MKSLPTLTLLLCCSLLLSGCMMPDKAKQAAENEIKLRAEGIMPLEPGELAEPFSAPLADGTSFSFSQALEQGSLILFFFPAIDTPNSTSNLQALGKLQQKLQEQGQAVAAYGITAASSADLHDYAERFQISLPLISDPGMSIAAQYGCAKAGEGLPQRTLLAIGPDGRILWYGRGFNPQELEKFLTADEKDSAAAPAE